MAGKWAHLRGELPDYEDGQSRGELFLERLAALRGRPLDMLTSEYNELAERKATLNAELKEINQDLDVYERTIDDTLETQNLESVVANGYRWTRSPEPYPSVTDKQAVREWALEAMPDALTVQPQTLKAVAKSRLENGEAPPPGVGVWLKNAISRRRA